MDLILADDLRRLDAIARRQAEALAEIRRALRPSLFQYIDLTGSRVLHFVDMGPDGEWVAVIGHGEDASYEWVLRCGGRSGCQFEYSDQGYGVSAVALRDGLSKFLDG